MGRDHHYKAGSFYRICDRTGFAARAENTQREWQGLFVKRDVFEVRQPQDFVKGVPDIQTVPYPRPRSPNAFLTTSTDAQFQVYGDLPSGGSFSVSSGSITVLHAPSVIDPSTFPSGF